MLPQCVSLQAQLRYCSKAKLTGYRESDESKERVAEPEDDTREDNVSCKRLDVIHIDRTLLLSSTDQLRLLTTNRCTHLLVKVGYCINEL